MLSNGYINCEFDSGNRLISAGGHTYTYNAEDVRIRNLCSDADTTYTYNTNCKLSQLLQKTTNGITTKYVYGLGLIGEEKEGCFKTYHFDYRGSTVAITDIYGNITDTFKYDTYGRMTEHIGNSFVILGYNGRDGAVTDRNGLLYMRARYYSPDMRRFINADIITGEISNAITLNRFAYANGNPVSSVDPFGLSAERSGDLRQSPNNLLYVTVIVQPKIAEYILESYIDQIKRIQLFGKTIAKLHANAINIGKRALVDNGRITIDMNAEKYNIYVLSLFFGLDNLCDIIAASACNKFYDENGSEFILSDACVSYEIKEHIIAYRWATGKQKYPNLTAIAGCILNDENKSGKSDKEFVLGATSMIDVKERDVIRHKTIKEKIGSQAFLYNYINGIRDIYIGTDKDPWADVREPLVIYC